MEAATFRRCPSNRDLPYIISEERPKQATDENTIRGSFLRFLALGGDKKNPIYEAGVHLSGGWITEELNFSAARLIGNFDIKNSVFEQRVNFTDAKAVSINFQGSYLFKGIVADRLNTTGAVYLSDGFASIGEVRFPRSNIGGEFNCQNGKFINFNKISILLNRSKIKNLYFTHGFESFGKIRMLGANIGGQLSCVGGSFFCKGEFALQCQGAKIKGSLMFREITFFCGKISLEGTTCSALADDKASWEKVERSRISGFNFKRHAHDEPWEPIDFIKWLKKDESKDGHLRKVVEIDFVAVWPSYGFGFSVFVIESGVIY